MRCLQNGLVFWLTGLSGSGKTTISNIVKERIKKDGIRTEILDGDWFRQNIDPEAGFTKEERRKHLIKVANVAKLLARNGIVTICSFVSPYEDVRNEIKNIIKDEANFYLIYAKCEIEECIKRDPKGLYKKALKGEIKNFTGIDDPYEEPKKYDLLLDTVKNSVEYNVEKLYNFIKEKINEVENQNK